MSKDRPFLATRNKILILFQQEMGGSTSATQRPVSKETVKSLDVEAYSGEWYDVAHIPTPYQDGCSNSIAFYIREKDGIYITNYCISNGKVTDKIEGRAYAPNPADSGKLLVEFEGLAWKRKGNYWVYDTDYDNYSLVGNGEGSAFWILSRTRQMNAALYNKLIRKMSLLGYDPELLIIHPLALVSKSVQEEARR